MFREKLLIACPSFKHYANAVLMCITNISCNEKIFTANDNMKEKKKFKTKSVQKYCVQKYPMKIGTLEKVDNSLSTLFSLCAVHFAIGINIIADVINGIIQCLQLFHWLAAVKVLRFVFLVFGRYNNSAM